MSECSMDALYDFFSCEQPEFSLGLKTEKIIAIHTHKSHLASIDFSLV